MKHKFYFSDEQAIEKYIKAQTHFTQKPTVGRSIRYDMPYVTYYGPYAKPERLKAIASQLGEFDCKHVFFNEPGWTSRQERITVRKPDSDLESYLQYNKDIFTPEDVADIHAEVAGHNDEDHWFWILELKDGRFLLTEAGCCYTGWDVASSGQSKVAESPEAAALLAPKIEDFSYRRIRENLLAQVQGKQPFGLEIVRNFEIDEELKQAAIANAQQDADMFYQQENKNLEGDAIFQQAQKTANGYKEPMLFDEQNIYVDTWIEVYENLAGLRSHED